jgi:hypothetical protein
MYSTAHVRCCLIGLGLAVLPAIGQAQGSSTPGVVESAAAKGVRCPATHETLYDAATKVLRCRRDTVSWVVTSCAQKEFSTYRAKPGADSCDPTEIPGVGTPPGVTGSRPVVCAASGYALVHDRTGPRDRCERVERSYALPGAVS